MKPITAKYGSYTDTNVGWTAARKNTLGEFRRARRTLVQIAGLRGIVGPFIYRVGPKSKEPAAPIIVSIWKRVANP